MKNLFKICFVWFLLVGQSFATDVDFSKYFEVDLDAELPDLEALRKEYDFQTAIYQPRYLLSYELGTGFDPVWFELINTYGTSERRLKSAGEDDLFDMIVSLPKEMYPYIGPFLHDSPNISEKILNLPGIKETKNKFPERIAPQLQDIEDLEFLSPYLYILLMPEMWPQNREAMEKPRIRFAKMPPVKREPKVYLNLFEKVSEHGLGNSSASGKQALKDQLRTLNVTKDSKLTSADVKAFAATLDNVRAFSTLGNQIKLLSADSLISYYEQKNNTALELNRLKDIVNPCQRLALKIKWAGLEAKFSGAIAEQGFDLKDWALTCDKTIKAYRIVVVSGDKLAAVKALKNGLAKKGLKMLSPRWRARQDEALYALFETYKTNEDDVLSVMKNEAELKEKLYPFGTMFVAVPLDFN